MIAVPGTARRARIELAPGRTLLAAVAEALGAIAWPSATLLLLGGALSEAVVYTSQRQVAGPRWISYGPPHRFGPIWFATGSGTFGPGLETTGEDSPSLHVHGTLAAPDGTPFGGHLDPALSILAGPIAAYAWGAPDALFRLAPDPTGFTLLGPAKP